MCRSLSLYKHRFYTIGISYSISTKYTQWTNKLHFLTVSYPALKKLQSCKFAHNYIQAVSKFSEDSKILKGSGDETIYSTKMSTTQH